MREPSRQRAARFVESLPRFLGVHVAVRGAVEMTSRSRKLLPRVAANIPDEDLEDVAMVLRLLASYARAETASVTDRNVPDHHLAALVVLLTHLAHTYGLDYGALTESLTAVTALGPPSETNKLEHRAQAAFRALFRPGTDSDTEAVKEVSDDEIPW